jgi:hypothetical protein
MIISNTNKLGLKPYKLEVSGDDVAQFIDRTCGSWITNQGRQLGDYLVSSRHRILPSAQRACSNRLQDLRAVPQAQLCILQECGHYFVKKRQAVS